MSSGTEKVAYQVGALKAIIENSDPAEVQYDVVAGVSFGAFNAAMVAVYDKGEEVEMINELYDIWKNTKKITAYKNWAIGPAQGVLFKGGLYNNAPWEEFLHKTLNGRGAKRTMTLGAINVNNGEYVDLTNLAEPEMLANAVFAATALNVFFPPVTEFGHEWFDGSGIWPIEVIGPIARCHEMGFKDKDIIVDVLMTGSNILPERNATNDSTIPSVIRYLEISDFYAANNGIRRARSGFKDVNFRYLVSPGSDPLPTDWFPFDFAQAKTDTLLERGYQDALKVIDEGHGKSFDRFIKSGKRKIRNAVPKQMNDFLKGEVD